MSESKGFRKRFDMLHPIRDLSEVSRDILYEAAVSRTVLDGQIVYSQHQQDESVFYLIDGNVELLSDGRPIRNLSSLHRASLRPLESHFEKRHTAKALTRSVICQLPRREFERLTASATEKRSETLEIGDIAERGGNNWMMKMMRSGIFAALTQAQIQEIFEHMESLDLRGDDVVCRQGDDGDYFYVVERGYCEVLRADKGVGEATHVTDLGPGEYFGEEALIGDCPRNATVTMLTDGALLRLKKQDFMYLIFEPTVPAASLARARQMISSGEATWLDIRPANQTISPGFLDGVEIPYQHIRQRLRRLDPARRYVVGGDEVGKAAIAAFMLKSRGIQAEFLDQSIADAVDDLRDKVEPKISKTQTTLPGEEYEMTDEDSTHDDSGSSVPSVHEDLTITRLDRVYDEAAAEADIKRQADPSSYAHTETGKSLADLIDEMHKKREALSSTLDSMRTNLTNMSGTAQGLDAVEMDDDVAPETSAAEENDTIGGQGLDLNVDGSENLDELGSMFSEFEAKLRDYVQREVTAGRRELAQKYETRMAALRQAATAKVKTKAKEIDAHYAKQYAQKEQTLRRHYKKLMGLAAQISQQKAQIQSARAEFEEKLEAANELHRQVAEMRETLKGHLARSGGGDSDNEDGRIAS